MPEMRKSSYKVYNVYGSPFSDTCVWITLNIWIENWKFCLLYSRHFYFLYNSKFWLCKPFYAKVKVSRFLKVFTLSLKLGFPCITFTKSTNFEHRVAWKLAPWPIFFNFFLKHNINFILSNIIKIYGLYKTTYLP